MFLLKFFNVSVSGISVMGAAPPRSCRAASSRRASCLINLFGLGVYSGLHAGRLLPFAVLAVQQTCGSERCLSITKNSVVVAGLGDHGDDRVKREVDGVRPFREIRRQPDLRWFAGALTADELDPVDDEGHRRYTIYAGRQEQFETDLHLVDAAFGGPVGFRHSR